LNGGILSGGQGGITIFEFLPAPQNLAFRRALAAPAPQPPTIEARVEPEVDPEPECSRKTTLRDWGRNN